MRQFTFPSFKSLTVLLLLVCMVPTQAQQRQYAIYNYRVDGGINAFINADIDSITYSNIGLDSMVYDNVVVQEIWTVDGVHRIPLEEVDSIAFQTPEPKLRENVFHITEQHLPYTVSTDSLHIRFLSSIPFLLTPQVGQVIISDTDETPFEDGFAGRVTSVAASEDGILVSCEPVELYDIFERLLIAKKAVSQTDQEANAPRKARRAEDNRHWWDIYEDDGNDTFTIPVDLSLSLLNGMFSASTKKPKVTCVWCVDVNPLGYKANFDFLIRHDEITFDMKLSMPKAWEDFNKVINDEEEDKYGWKRKKLKVEGKWPIVPGLVDFGLEFGIGYKGSVDFDGKWSTSATQKINFDVYGKNLDVMMPPVVVLHECDTDFGEIEKEASISVNGGIQLGLKPNITIKLLSKYLLAAEAFVEGGIEANAAWQISSKDRPLDYSMYELFKDVSISSDWFVQGGVNANIAGYKIGELKAKKTWEIGKWYMFPHLTMPELPEYKGNSTFSGGIEPTSLTIHPTHDVLKSATLGLDIYDDKGELVKESQAKYEYDKESSWRDKYLQIPLNDLRVGHTYTCHPIIQYDLWGLSGKIDVESLSKEITIPEMMSVAKTDLTIHKEKSTMVELIGGWGTYEMTSSNPKVASVTSLEIPSLGRMYALIKGLKTGTAQVTVTDVRSNVTETISVTVAGEGGSLSLAGGSYQLKVGDKKSVEIIDGSGKFTASSDNADVATCYIEGCYVVVTAVGGGLAKIIVNDSETGESAELEIVVVKGEEYTIPKEGLVAYYPFNGNANDESGNGNHGIDLVGVTLTNGVNGDIDGAYQFGGFYNWSHIRIPNSESLQFSEGCSFSVYIKPTNWGGMDGWANYASEGNHCILGKKTDRVGMYCRYGGNEGGITAGSGCMNASWADIGTERVEGNYLNKWVHMAFVYGKTFARVYVNGELKAEKECTPDFGAMNGEDLFLGAFPLPGSWADWWYPMEGAMDELSVYNRALNSTEVESLAGLHDWLDGSMQGGSGEGTDPDVPVVTPDE